MLKQVIRELKAVKRDLIVIGVVPAQILWRTDYDFDSGEELKISKKLGS